jgi:CRISPR/Cas system-associated exonuclease Cas4 (RecB family)
MAEADHFNTEISGTAGIWPPTPDVWSYSSLREAEECPRRWMLSRATYPSIWQRRGYPSRPILPALVGEVVHRVLELILFGLYDRGCQSLAQPCAVGVLKELGGYSKLVEKAIGERLAHLQGNPRIEGRIGDFRYALLRRLPDIRQRVQAIITRTTIEPVLAGVTAEASDEKRGPLIQGSHPEVELRVPELRFVGRADLVTVADGGCIITDYKTGAAEAHHAEQLRTYALLWKRDRLLNPTSLPVRSLVLAYATHDEAVEPPTNPELESLARQLAERIVETEKQLRLRPPPAYPSPAICGLCAVRHLCEEYWATLPANIGTSASSEINDFIDCEAVVTSRNGPRSWMVQIESIKPPILLRSPTETPGFRVGNRVRLLDVAHGRDADGQGTTLTMTQATEVFVLNERP